jgi:DNA-binding CsgD family transcriptional regulator
MAHVHACFGYCEDLVMSELSGDFLQVRCVFNYRLQHADGHYLHVHDEKASFRLGNGTTVYFCMMRDISHEKTFTGVKVEVFKLNGSLVKLGEYAPAKTSQKLSPREQDLIVLIRQGLTTKEIAYQLNISHNTVRNIRSKMFEKYRVNNVVELLNMTYS